ncbi:MAG: DUF2961 domain-containing protein [Pirellulales bacterium]|nr:DUF2961 domain-containing protein [Pirellulales bacterium]
MRAPRRPARFRSVVLLPLLALIAGVTPSVGRADQMGELTQPIPGRPHRASSGLFDPESNRDPHHAEPGQRLIIADLDGPGEIRHLWFTLASRDRRYPRNVMLRIYYDGSKVPSVETPIGDFFAAGNGMKACVRTKPIEVSSFGRALNCYWRMPFRKHCRIEVHNQSSQRTTVYFHGDWLKLDSLPEDTYYFHARYRQEYPAKPFSWYTVFEGKGEGHYVGTVFSSQNNLMSWFGEADDRFYVDGEEIPSIIGTGTEDYFNDAWNLRITSGARVGTTICEPKGLQRRITAYRWHIDDPIPFKKSLKFEIERRSFAVATDPKTGRRYSWDFKYRPDYWSSVAFWYQKGVAEPLWHIPPAKDRLLPEIWVEPTYNIDKIRTSPGLRPLQRSNRTCNLKRFTYVRNDKPGAWIEMPVTIPTKGRYAITLIPNLYKEHGVWKITLRGPGGERVLDPGFDFWDYRVSHIEDWPENFEHGTTLETKLGVQHLDAGEYTLRFECIGANPATRHPETGEFGKGFSIGLDAISFRRLPIEYPYAWMQDYLAKEKKLFDSFDREAKSTLAALDQGIQRYQKEHGRYPDNLNKLVAAGTMPGPRIPLDPWHQYYCYRVPGVIRPWSFDVYTVHGDSREPRNWFGNWKNPFRVADLAREIGGIAFEGEDLKPMLATEGVRPYRQRISSWGEAPLSGQRSLLVPLKQPGDAVEIALPASLPEGTYDVYLYLPCSWNYGISQWSLGGQDLGKPYNAHRPTIGMRSLAAKNVRVEKGSTLRVESVGKDEYATGYYAGLDGIIFRPVDKK